MDSNNNAVTSGRTSDSTLNSAERETKKEGKKRHAIMEAYIAKNRALRPVMLQVKASVP
jgi:hypothetical protein